MEMRLFDMIKITRREAGLLVKAMSIYEHHQRHVFDAEEAEEARNMYQRLVKIRNSLVLGPT